MTQAAPRVTHEQLERLYQARNKANSVLAMARRIKAPGPLAIAREEAVLLNQAYEAARRSFKRQQKADARAQWRAERKQFYKDQKCKSN